MVKTVYNWPEIGNDRAIKFLDESLKSGRVAQTYVFIGSDDLGKSTVALALAQNLQGEKEGFNSDLYILQPESDKKNISIEATRDFIKMLSLSSFLNSYKVGIIKEADALSLEAKNALLKTLEEPASSVVIILLVREASNLPDTILSRAQILHFYPVASNVIYEYLVSQHGAERSLAQNLAQIVLGRPLLAVKLLEDPIAYKLYLEKAEQWLGFYTVDLNERLPGLNNIFSDKSWGRQSVLAASEIISLAESLARDLLLLSLGQDDRVQYRPLINSLRQTLITLNTRGEAEVFSLLINQLKLINQAREYLATNVNPRLVLEQLLINLV